MAAWIGEEAMGDPASLLKSFPAARPTMWPVSEAVGKNQGAELAEPVGLT